MVLLTVTQPAAGPSRGSHHVQSTEHKAGFLPERRRGRRAQPWTESREAGLPDSSFKQVFRVRAARPREQVDSAVLGWSPQCRACIARLRHFLAQKLPRIPQGHFLYVINVFSCRSPLLPCPTNILRMVILLMRKRLKEGTLTHGGAHWPGAGSRHECVGRRGPRPSTSCPASFQSESQGKQQPRASRGGEGPAPAACASEAAL